MQAVEKYFGAVSGNLKLLRDKGNVAVPSDDTARLALAGCFSQRDGRWRKTKPSNELSALLWQLVKFHRGSGNLWGWPWFADEQTRDELDTLAVLLLGGESRAVNAWQAALGR